eukprot:TRINITY_DN19201_c0_g3_i1.p1 TRINITY_DN19201_c0_g3~~TRINITY_DN19201_c0_g3_i1.p1  ORF type:complete len:718 (+),score=312.76 TRINITY_DN19201_c0_g3_i1:138-2156(+)
MEDTGSQEVKDWVKQQNELTRSFIDSYEHKEKIYGKIKERFDYEKHGLPFKEGDTWYYFFNTGLQNQSVLYTKKDIHDKEEKGAVFLDPNELAADGTSALGAMDWTDDGKYLAYGVKKKGSDWSILHVKDCTTGEDLPDKVEWVKHSGVSWDGPGKGFFYSRYPNLEPGVDLGSETDKARDQRLCYHKLGTPQSEDITVYYNKETPDILYGGSVSEDGKYCIIDVCQGCEPNNKIWYIPMDTFDPATYTEDQIVKVVDEFKWSYSFIGNKGTLFYFMTTEEADNKKVVTYNIDTKEWATFLPEAKDVLEWADLGYNDTMYASYMQDVKDVVYYFSLSDPTNMTKIETEIGSVSLSTSLHHGTVFYAVTSFIFARRMYCYEVDKGASTATLWYEAKVVDHDSTMFEVEQVFYPSKDGTKVPMFMVHKKGMVRDGNNPCLLYGYGGFRVSMGISFSTSLLTFINNFSGVYVLANIRGGLEYGEKWWKGGSLKNKQNCFDDFIYAAKWLQENGITCPSKLTIKGGSNGGTLVAACANQAPELFGCVVAQVGVMDMTRFHKFTIGASWRSDFGDPDVKEDYDYIMTYSPYHNIDAKKTYPATLCLTGDHDDRVVPLHTYKYTAEIQHQCKDQENPFFALIEVDAGHGAGKPTEKVISELTDTYAFIAKVCNAVWTD